jgi:Putative Flp pilus-assembly TadE/G-like
MTRRLLRAVMRRRRPRDERGAAAILMALSLTAVLISAGLVIDFGIARYERTINKSTSDAAALAGAGAVSPGDGLYHPWGGVCTALSYLQANDSRLSSLVGSYKNGAGSGISGSCTPTAVPNDTLCVANQPSTWAWFTGTSTDGNVTVEIRNGYSMPDTNFADDTVLAGDTGSASMGGCDQLAVIVTESQQPGLGSLATSSDLVTKVRSVARLIPNTTGSAPIALLLLERHNCLALQAGSNNTYIDVLGFGPSPGYIHSDSLGDQVGTGSDCNSGNKALYGKFAKHIIARHSETGGVGGVISVAALSGAPGAVPANATDGSANVCAELANGTCANAIGRGVLGRRPIDTRYLTGVRTALTNASAATGWSTATAGTNGYTVWTPANCSNITVATPPTTGGPNAANLATLLFVNCPSGATFKSDTLIANALNVVFNGKISIGSGNSLSIPKAQKVWVKGATGGSGIDISGALALGTYTNTTATNKGSAQVCPATQTARDQLVIMNGAFTGGAQANFHLCGTAVVMGDGWTGTSCPVPTTPTPVSVEPSDNLCYGYVSLGGGGFMEWTAPNLAGAGATSTDWNALEDLTLWTESSGTVSGTTTNSSIGGGGQMYVAGVFFLPNANPFVISGGSFQANGANAQFIVRRLSANGSGSLTMRPNPNDSVSIPPAPSTSLVR